MFKRQLPIIISLAVLSIIIIPYLFASQMNGAQSVFGGFLINPVDGHSYLAKMRQGLMGEWRFVLPYTAESGAGAYLFLFYLTLGHIARILHIPLLFMFHGIRLAGAVFLLWVLYKFNNWIFADKQLQNLGFAISALGSGLGWLAVLTGKFTSDFWVAEAYPFLSMYSNPHFTIGLALMILALMPGRDHHPGWDLLLGLATGIIQPFAVVIVIVIKTTVMIIEHIFDHKSLKAIVQSSNLLPVLMYSVGGGSILAYQYWSILSDPVLSLWNGQNVTPSPGFLDLFLSLSPCLIFAVVGVPAAWKDEKGKVLVIWAGLSLILAAVPWNLQRRFLTGIFLPIAGLAIFGLYQLKRLRGVAIRSGFLVLFILALPTNIIVVYSGLQAASNQDLSIYFPGDIQEALSWVRNNSEEKSLILAKEEIGLLIPSITGRRVIYGHPFETANAESEREFLQSFFVDDQEPDYYDHTLVERNVDILFVSGKISSGLKLWIEDNDLIPDFTNNGVQVYQLSD